MVSLVPTTKCLTRCSKLSCWGRTPLGPGPFRVPLVLTRESSCGRRPGPCLHSIAGPSPQLETKERPRSSTLTRQLQGAVSSGLWKSPEGEPGQSSSVASTALACSQRVPMRQEKRERGKNPKSPYRPPKMSWSRCKLEKNF